MRAFVPALLLTLVVPPLLAQEARAVVVGPQYEAGAFVEFWFGKGYRDLWTTPIDVPLLDLEEFAGGLTPVRVVGQAQSLGLAMRGADGRAYTFRSLHKHPERMLPEAWRDRWPAKIAQDQTSGTHPAAGLILSPLAEAVGVPTTNPLLVVMPDDPALGEFRKQFAGEIGTINEFPLPAGDENPGFMQATEIASTRELWDLWLEGPEDRIDSHAFLRARVLDLWLDNFDRHAGQWRWMRIPGEPLWQPLPEDPDMVLVHHDGRVMASLRSHIPRLLRFTEKYSKRLEGPLMNNFEVDRWLLSDLERNAWEEIAREVQGRLTDGVIEEALRAMPREWYALDGDDKLASLQTRRDGLVDYVLRVYDYYADKVDIHATNQAERVTIARAEDDVVEVKIAVAGSDSDPYYRRSFAPDETGEVRIYLHGGDDRVERTERPKGPITVRVIAGGGTDVVDDSASGGTDVWRDAGEVEVARGRGTRVREGVWKNPDPKEDRPWLEPRSFGHWTVPQTIVGWAPDVELLIGAGFTRTSWGFRNRPEATIQTLRGAFATGDMNGKLEYVGTFRKAASGLSLRLHAFGSGIERVNFFGLGNDTPEETDRARYKTEENAVVASPTLRWESGPRFEVHAGPEIRYSESPTSGPTIVGHEQYYGTGRFGTVALRAGLHLDTRGRPEAHASADLAEGFVEAAGGRKVTGLQLLASGSYVPEVWDAESGYGWVDGFVATYVGNSTIHLALRAGGRKVWGTYPWFDAAFVGGLNNRGFRIHRFAGDASLYGTAELRLWAGHLPTPIVPLRFGFLGFGDVGRVWLEGEDSDTWHPSGGGGLLLQPMGAPVTVRATVGASTEGTRFYFGAGYAF
jgi:hypothetical protein